MLTAFIKEELGKNHNFHQEQ